MCQEPWIEPLPVYQKSGKTISSLTEEDLPGLNEQEITDFKSLVSCGLFKDYELHAHQAEMLKKTLDCNNCVVTAGTGSGKTESFLLPLFAYLSRESSMWEAPGTPDPRVNNWWNDTQWQNSCISENNRIQHTYRIPQRGHEKREAAVRALIIYPMNALANSQYDDFARRLAGSGLKLALYTGGDFGLLFTVRPDMIEAARGVCDLSVIGDVVRGDEGVMVELASGSVECVNRKGYEQLAIINSKNFLMKNIGTVMKM